MIHEPDKPPTHAPLTLAYFRDEIEASERSATITASERWMPIWAWLAACASFAVSRGSDMSPAGAVVFFYFCGVGCVLALDATRRPGKAWVVSLCGLVLTSATCVVVLIRVLQGGL